MYQRFSFFLLCFLISTSSHAVTCYITMVKDSCWKDYNLTVSVKDAGSGDEITSILVAEGDAWGRQQFECNPGQTLALEAQFSPVFWSGEEDKKFPAQRYWKLPAEMENGITGWNVTVCYPKWFANVPVPPNATSNCKCDTDSIPPVEPRKL